MLVKRTSKNQLTLPKAFLEAANIREEDRYFDAEYDAKKHVISLKPVRIVIEEKVSEDVIERFENEALQVRPGDKVLGSRKEADRFLEGKTKK